MYEISLYEMIFNQSDDSSNKLKLTLKAPQNSWLYEFFFNIVIYFYLYILIINPIKRMKSKIYIYRLENRFTFIFIFTIENGFLLFLLLFLNLKYKCTKLCSLMLYY